MGSQKRNHDSTYSSLLTNEENHVVAQLLGPRCPSLATTVVQIYKSEGPSHNRWNKRTSGVICFVKDNPRRSYFIRVFDMDRKIVVFDQEIYNQFRYKTPRPYFHTFEAEDGQVGLNFADETEAAQFQKIVEDKLAERRQRRERRAAVKQRHSLGSTNGAVKGDAPPPPSSTGIPVYNVSTAPSTIIQQSHQPAHLYFSMKKKGEKKVKLKKEDISLPTNFQHISHVGWDPNRGFDLENVDPKLKQFFSRAGVSERELQDKETRDFIYNFIEKHGGVEAALQETSLALMEEDNRFGQAPDSPMSPSLPFVSAPPAPAPPPRNSSISRPPPPSKVQASPHKPEPPPPPPSHARQQQQQQQPQQIQQSPRRPQAPPIVTTVAPAPPPPPPPPPPPQVKSSAPMPPAPPPPPPPMPPPSVPNAPPPPSLPPVDDVRSNLMAQIRLGGGTLRHVSEEKKKTPPTIDTRCELLDQIRSGVTLKKVDVESLSREEDDALSDGIAGMLQKALQERSAALCLSSSEDEEADDEDEWDE